LDLIGSFKGKEKQEKDDGKVNELILGSWDDFEERSNLGVEVLDVVKEFDDDQADQDAVDAPVGLQQLTNPVHLFVLTQQHDVWSPIGGGCVAAQLHSVHSFKSARMQDNDSKPHGDCDGRKREDDNVQDVWEVFEVTLESHGDELQNAHAISQQHLLRLFLPLLQPVACLFVLFFDVDIRCHAIFRVFFHL